MITNFNEFRKVNETSAFQMIDNFAFVKGAPGIITDFLDSLNEESNTVVKRINDTTVKIINNDEGLFNELLSVAEGEFHLHIEYPMNLNRRVVEGFMDPVSPAKMQKKVDEVNKLIETAKDGDGDPLGVIDTSSTWQAEMRFKPVIYKNGFVYTEYTQTGETKPNKDRYKPSDSYDAYQWLSQIATWYRRAMKKAGVVFPPTGLASPPLNSNPTQE